MDSIIQEKTLTVSLYVPRKDGGRELMQIEGAYITEVIKFEGYVECKEDPLIHIKTHQCNTNSRPFQPTASRKLFRMT
jgi:hypothetical protein